MASKIALLQLAQGTPMDKDSIKSPKVEESDKGQESPSDKSPSFDAFKLLNDAQGFFKSLTPKSTDAQGLPSLQTFDSKEKKAEGTTEGTKGSDKAGETGKAKSADADKPKIYVLPAETKPPHQLANPEAQPKQPAVAATRDAAGKPAIEASRNAQPPDLRQKEIASNIVSRITDSSAPVSEIKEALRKLDNLKDATVTVNNGSSHIDINLMQGQNAAAPNISVRGFTPVQTHLDSHLSFDLKQHQNGFSISNMQGFSGTVRGPWGNYRHSETSSMFVGKDAYGGYINTTSDLHMRRRIHTSTTTLREGNLPENSPMKALMQHPDSLKKIEGMMRLFQGTEDISKMGIKRNGTTFDVSTEAKASKHVELNFTPKPDENALIKIPVTIKSLDLEKGLSASLNQEKDSVSLEKISGIKANVQIGKLETTIVPTKVSIENDKVKLELKGPDGTMMPVSIPISKLKEAARKLNH